MSGSLNQCYVMSVRFTPPIGSDYNLIQHKLHNWYLTYGKNFIYQLEDTKDNKHFQGYINLKKKTRAKTLAIDSNNDFSGIEIRPASNNGKEALKLYCMKEDTRINGPWADKEIYRGQDLIQQLYPWQAELKHYCLEPYKKREIIWIYDKEGGKGKSEFVKYMVYKHKAIPITYMTTANMMNLVAQNISKIYLVDLTRAKPMDISGQDLYAGLESIKNGLVINGKYQTNFVCFEPPHVIVFANNLPKKGCMTEDRWRLKVIDNNREIQNYIPEPPMLFVNNQPVFGNQ